ncbi:hypothetical protein RIF29_31316 [Crotalaria pallida]|uniref:Uncharacterized protein n=1 Tax=Crotalaria pallida TaxID=3830 RepID=A0AAN9HV69_CROPI
MEATDTVTTTPTTAAGAGEISEQGNKENIPPSISNKTTKGKCNKKKKKKNPIQPKATSFKKGKSGNKQKSKRVPLADITDLFNNSSTVTLRQQQQQHQQQQQQPSDSVAEVPSSSSAASSSIPLRRSTRVPPSKSKSLRMGFR